MVDVIKGYWVSFTEGSPALKRTMRRLQLHELVTYEIHHNNIPVYSTQYVQFKLGAIFLWMTHDFLVFGECTVLVCVVFYVMSIVIINHKVQDIVLIEIQVVPNEFNTSFAN